MVKLHEVNAVIKGQKTLTKETVDSLYKIIQKEQLFDGRVRSYKPIDDEGEKLPDERQLVQYKAEKVLNEALSKWGEVLDLCLTQDIGNTQAKGNIVVDDKTIMTNVPVSTLLFLEKLSQDVETFVNKLPVPDMSEEWTYDQQSDLLKTAPAFTVRTKKVLRNHQLSPATDRHPAQVQTYTEDMIIGHYQQVLSSGRMSAQRKNQILSRIRAFRDAVKTARERANSIEVTKHSVSKAFNDFLLAA